MKKKQIAVLIPCYNEELTIEKVINDFRKELPDAKIYVYNNNSIDNSKEIAFNAGAIVVDEYKQGKGNVVSAMFSDIDADIYILVDSDDTYPAESIHMLVEPVVLGIADMVVGDRLSNGTYKSQNKRQFHRLGNNIVRRTVNILFKVNLKDIMSGYRVFNKDFVKNFPAISKGFEVETEMTFHALDRNYRIIEIPINYRNRPNGSVSKLHTFKDGLKVITTIFRMYKDYKPLKFFGLIALILCFISLNIGIPLVVDFFKTGIVTKFPSGILATGIMILSVFCFGLGIVLDSLVRHHKEELKKYLEV